MKEIIPYFSVGLSFVCALAIAVFAIPKIIYVAKKKRLLDRPDNHRKLHKAVIPNLGGIGIFFAYIIVSSLFITPIDFPAWTFISAATLVLFVTGVYDDLVSLSPSKKFIAQAFAACITVFFADIRLSSLYGLGGVYELPAEVSYVFTIIGCVFVTNAFNLIDGIDGLAGTISALGGTALGLVFLLGGQFSEACVAFSLAGAVAGFLRYNISPARIFMGDTGSLIIGFTLSLLCIIMVETYNPATAAHYLVHSSEGALLLALSVLFIPLFDTFRVFTTRILRGHSPFRADRTHLHHYLLDLGCSHSQAVGILTAANAVIFLVAFLVQDINPLGAVFSMAGGAFGLFVLLFYLRHKKVTPHARFGSRVSLRGGRESVKK